MSLACGGAFSRDEVIHRVLCRISKRQNDPKRREALKSLLASSKTAPPPPKQPDVFRRPSDADSGSWQTAPAPVPSLSIAPVLKQKAIKDDARVLNRTVMWEELAKQGAELCVPLPLPSPVCVLLYDLCV